MCVCQDCVLIQAADETVGETRFTEADLACVAGLIGLQTITSTQEHQGSRRLFLFEQLTHLDRSAAQLRIPACHPTLPCPLHHLTCRVVTPSDVAAVSLRGLLAWLAQPHLLNEPVMRRPHLCADIPLLPSAAAWRVLPAAQ